MIDWEQWKKGFDAWEEAAATRLEQLLRSPLWLTPWGALVTMLLRNKVTVDGALSSLWGLVGLPTKRDQERTLHALNQLESRIIDLEETIKTRSKQRAPR